MMGYKKTIFLVLCIMLISLSGCQKEEQISIRGEITSVNMSSDNKIVSILVEGELEEDTFHDKASIKIDNNTRIYIGDAKKKVSADELEEGMIVESIFKGPVAESYPVQAKAKLIRILE